MIMMVTVTMVGVRIVVAGDDFYLRAITGIDYAGGFGLQGHMRNSETGLQHLPRRANRAPRGGARCQPRSPICMGPASRSPLSNPTAPMVCTALL